MPEPRDEPSHERPAASTAERESTDSRGIPDAPAGDPTFDAEAADDGTTRPLAALPDADFWGTLYARRSIRKFKPDPVPRELVDQVMHAGIWAPSSCNYQMWDLVAVDDPDVNARLAALSTQMANAPVNIVVSYGRDFSEEAWANIQSASALVQNMSLAAQALGLGTFWITQTGGAERVREAVGLPYDRMVIAVLAVGWPKVVPKRGPKRRPLRQVTHWNHYAGRPIPSSTRPADWAPDLLAIYQRARVLNGLRHNKPRAWEVRALDEALDALLPEGQERAPGAAPTLRWLDVLPCTGIVTARLGVKRPAYQIDVVERTREVAEFVAQRVSPPGATFGWPDTSAELPDAEAGAYDVVSCVHRLEGLDAAGQRALFAALARWIKPDGRVLVAYVSRRSYHDWTERLRARRGGPRGVEYVLSPDPNIGPFETLEPSAVEALAREAGFTIAGEFTAQAAPSPEEVEFRARNFSARTKRVARAAGTALRAALSLPGLRTRRARLRYLLLRRA
ncbi:MAG: nitroreductase family protein [Planctomycetota bacterium]